MDYLRLQADAKDENRNLLFVFAVIIGVVAATAAAVVTATTWATLILVELFAADQASDQGRELTESEVLSNRTPWGWVFFVVFVLVAGVIAWVSRSRERALIAHGGLGIARSLGGRCIDARSADPAERRFVNAVAEMAIAARRTTPAVFVLDGHTSINAFNAGWTDETTAIGVTSGALSDLRREELQAVAAQAMSHVFHGDARLNLRLMGLVTGVAGLAMVGEDWIEGSKTTDTADGDEGVFVPLFVAGSLLYAVGWVGVWLSNKVQRSVARRHELLADATAIELLRQSEPMRDALRRVGGHPAKGLIRHRRARSMNHLFMVDAGGRRRGGLHPDLTLRVHRIDPNWVGDWLKPDTSDHVSPDGPIPSPSVPMSNGTASPLAPAFDALTAPLAGLVDVGLLGPAGARLGLPDVGTGLLTPVAGLAVFEELTSARPAMEANRARSLLAALTHHTAAVSPTAASVPEGCSVEAVLAQVEAVLSMTGEQRRAAAENACRALVASNGSEASFAAGVVAPLRADRELDHWMLRRRILGRLGAATATSTKRRPLERLRNEYAVALGFLTAIGGGDAATAFAVGVAKADLIGLHARRPGKLAGLERALDKLTGLDPDDHDRALDGMEAAMYADGDCRESELEFIDVVRLALRTDSALATAGSPERRSRRSWRARLRTATSVGATPE